MCEGVSLIARWTVRCAEDLFQRTVCARAGWKDANMAAKTERREERGQGEIEDGGREQRHAHFGPVMSRATRPI